MQKIEIVQTLCKNAVIGFKGCGIFLINFNQISKHHFTPKSPGTQKISTDTSCVAIASRGASEDTAPQQEGRLTPSQVPTARSFEDVSKINQHIANKGKKNKTFPNAGRSEMYLEVETKTSALGRETSTANGLINKKARQASHGSDAVCLECMQIR